MKRGVRDIVGLACVLALALVIACAPAATPTSTPTATAVPASTPTATAIPTPSPTPTVPPAATSWTLPPGFPTPTPRDNSGAQPPPGARVVSVGQEIEHEGITVGFKEVWLTDKETILRLSHACATFMNLEALGAPFMLVDGASVHGSGGGGAPCDASHITEFRFPALPRGAREISFSYGPFLGPDTRDLTLELPVGQYLSKLDPKWGGKTDIDMLVEADGLAYRFTRLDASVTGVTLKYEPTNEPARWQPLQGPPGVESSLEDDRGNKFTISGGGGGYDGKNGFALTSSELQFSGTVDMGASVWTLKASKLGKIYRGPWEFKVDVSAYTGALPLATPTPTQRPATTPIPPVTIVPGFTWPSRLRQALSWAPIEFADRPIIKYADYQGARAAVGMEEARGITAIRQGGADVVKGPLGNLQLHDEMAGYWSDVYEKTALDMFGFDLSLWVDVGSALGAPMWTGSFMAMQGPMDRELMASKLPAIQFKEAEYRGVPYYWLYEGDPQPKLTDPLRLSGPYLNNVALVEGGLMAAPTTQDIQSLIDARQGAGQTLADSVSHASIAVALGDGLLGGDFLTPGYVLRAGHNSDSAYAARLGRYLEGENTWGKLSPYTLAFLGYRLAGQTEELVVAFYYSDPSAAERDAKELERRWSTFYYDSSGSNQAEVKAIDACAPFKTRAVKDPNGSVLVGSCQVAPKAPGVSGGMLWQTFLWLGELHIMAPDIAALQQAVLQK